MLCVYYKKKDAHEISFERDFEASLFIPYRHFVLLFTHFLDNLMNHYVNSIVCVGFIEQAYYGVFDLLHGDFPGFIPVHHLYVGVLPFSLDI